MPWRLYRAFYEDFAGRVRSVDFWEVTGHGVDPFPEMIEAEAKRAVRRAIEAERAAHPGIKIHRGSYVLKMIQDLTTGDMIYPPSS